MGLYQNKILPKLLHQIMQAQELVTFRARLLEGLQGEVVELGFGTGLNLPYYPPAVSLVQGVEIAPPLLEMAQPLIQKFPGQVRLHLIDGIHLPFADNSQTQIIVSWSLCSVAQLLPLLSEVHRILKVDGSLRFVEHGLSPKPWLARLQNWVTPLHRRIGGGCHLNRNFEQILRDSGLFEVNLERIRVPRVPFWINTFYVGKAIKRKCHES